MKKLMVAAAAAAMTAGAFADACSDIDAAYVANCLVYDVQIKVKTLSPKLQKCSEDNVYYLDNISRTLKGYMWFCDDACWDTDDDVRIVLWDKKDKAPVVPLWYVVENNKIVQYPETFNFDFLGRYGKKANKVAAEWQLDTDALQLLCAGVNGKSMKSKYGDLEEGEIVLKSISGNCAGALALGEITVKGHCGDVDTFTAKIAELCDCWENWCDDGDDADAVPATGTWKISYNSKYSKSNKSMLEIVPSYARLLEE